MAAELIQASTLSWRIRQLGKNLSEWVQLQLSRSRSSTPDLPDVELPAWIGRLLVWLLIAGLILWLAWLIVQLAERSYDTWSQRRLARPTEALSELSPPPQSGADWLRQAHQWAQQQRWHAACRALYMAALQQLHERQGIPHQKSRTDGEYLQAIQQLPQSRPLQLLIRTHERSLFGAVSLNAEHWHRCRRAYEELTRR